MTQQYENAVTTGHYVALGHYNAVIVTWSARRVFKNLFHELDRMQKVMRM